MAFGRHFEWRGFGPPAAPVCREIEALPRLFPDEEHVRDRYLWVPGSPLNVKLRYGDLKIKRHLGGTGGIEEWLEDPSDVYAFPLAPPAVEDLARSFGSRAAPPRAPIRTEDHLIAFLRRAMPSLGVIAVEKVRQQYSLAETAAVIVELARILAPEVSVSVAVEAPEREDVARALGRLRLPRGLVPLNYVEALEVWGRGGRLPLA